MLIVRILGTSVKRRLCDVLYRNVESFANAQGSSALVVRDAAVSRPWQPAVLLPVCLYSASSNAQLVNRLSQAGQGKDLSAVLSVIESAGEEFDITAVEEALKQVEHCTEGMPEDERKAKLHDNKTFQMLSDMAVSTAGEASPEVLARSIGLCGRLGCDEMVLDSLARHLIAGVGKLQPEQMQQLVDGLGSADHSPSVLLLDAIQERLQGLGERVQQQQARSIKDGLHDLGHDDLVHPPNPEPQDQSDRINYT